VEPLAGAQRAFSEGRLEAARALADEAVRAQAGAPALTMRAAILYGLEDHAAALADAVAATTVAPASDVAHARLGSVLEKLGRLGEAEAAFRRADELCGGAKAYATVSFDPEVLRIIQSPRALPVPSWAQYAGPARAEGFRFVVLACCDGAYFRKYGFNFVNSYAASASGASLLHLHVADPDAQFEKLVQAIGAEIALPALRVTTERSPFGDASPTAARHCYYSCIRLFGLPELVRSYRRPVVCVDIDSILEASLDPLVDASASADVGLARRIPQHAPWTNILAGWIVAQPTPSAVAYLEQVQRYVLHFMQRGRARWHLDQAACYCVLAMLRACAGAPPAGMLARVRGILTGKEPPLAPPNVCWLAATLQERLWHMGHSYDERLEDDRFRRFSPRALRAGS
jgi:tetratricopeptide (TPR) repeat protein